MPRRRRKQANPCTGCHLRYAAIASCALVLFLVLANVNRRGDDPIISRNANMEKLISSSRPFQYIGDIDPSEPQPWPVDEKDWHALHETLVKRVQESDATSTNQVRDYLPQLIFYGDSITEGWSGTSFGHLPGPHRMWTAGEEEYIRDVFTNAFGDNSDWGKRALKPPLVLGISGSRTYDFIWRVVNGEFPVSSLLDNTGENKENNTNEVFPIEKLERIYILLMGTNNLGGGMLPKPTLKGMDTAGRTILQLHEKHFPNTPAALLFSELLPRKDDFRAVKMCPPRCKNFEKLEPYQSFMPAIKKVNQELPNMLNSWREDFQNSRIILLSANTKTNEVGETDQNDNKRHLYTPVITCGKEMFAFDDLNEFDVYLPDRLHPNAKGYELWSRCLKKGLGTIMTR